MTQWYLYGTKRLETSFSPSSTSNNMSTSTAEEDQTPNKHVDQVPSPPPQPPVDQPRMLMFPDQTTTPGSARPVLEEFRPLQYSVEALLAKSDPRFGRKILSANHQWVLIFPCPKGIHPDDRFSTCAKKIIKGLLRRLRPRSWYWYNMSNFRLAFLAVKESCFAAHQRRFSSYTVQKRHQGRKMGRKAAVMGDLEEASCNNMKSFDKRINQNRVTSRRS
eukprot:sb/3469890/